MSHKNSPFDPRNINSSAFYYTFVANNRGHRREPPPSGCGGCGCLMLGFLFFLTAIVVSNWR